MTQFQKKSCFPWILGFLSLLLASEAGAAEIVKSGLGAKIDRYLTGITPFGFAGAVLVARGDEILLNKGYGLAIRSQNVPDTADTIFCLGSITKQFTAAAIMTLEIQGKLKTEDPLTTYIEDVPADKSGLTLHHLLTHTSGLVPDVGGDYEKAERDETVRKILALPLESKPGERFVYSNVNYTLLAAIVEKVSGRPYETYLYEHLFKPAGMEWTGYRRPKWNTRAVAHWYSRGQDNLNSLERPFPYWNLIGNGGILSMTDDMFKWHKALLGEKILSTAAKKKLFTPFLNEYAYGWDVLKTPRGTLIQHNGGSDLGNNAEIRRYVDAGIVTILLCNQFYSGRPLIDAVRGKIEGLAFGGDVPLPPLVKALDLLTLKKYEGSYSLSSGGFYAVSIENNSLQVRAQGQDAIAALVFPEGIDPNALDELNKRSQAILEAVLRNDFGPLSEALDNKEKRLSRVRDLLERRIAEDKSRTGKIERVEALRTLPSAMEAGALETAVVLRGEKGVLAFRLIWRDGKNIGIGPLDLIAPVFFPFQPLSETEFAGHDLASAKNMKISFELAGGSAKSLTVLGKTKITALKRQ
jgi:CubicO group peptidase (beta-lactamase class C family)